MLITRILVLFKVDLSYESLTRLGRNHYFSTKASSELDIVNVDDTWQYRRIKDVDVDDDDTPNVTKDVPNIEKQNSTTNSTTK